jgi:hypothetical protein
LKEKAELEKIVQSETGSQNFLLNQKTIEQLSELYNLNFSAKQKEISTLIVKMYSSLFDSGVPAKRIQKVFLSFDEPELAIATARTSDYNSCLNTGWYLYNIALGSCWDNARSDLDYCFNKAEFSFLLGHLACEISYYRL